MEYESRSAPGASYRLGRRLKSGSTGAVFETRHPLFPGACAIKVLRTEITDDPDALESFRADVEAVAALRHPNIVHVLEVTSLPDGPTYVVMELLEGRLLAERLAGRHPVPVREAVQIVKAVAAALQAAHSRGVVHGEINPSNVFLARTEGYDQGVVKLLGFGMARLRPLDAPASLTVEAARFLSPEQAAGRIDDVDHRSDQFALAALAHRMLSGADAVRGGSVLSLIMGLVHGETEVKAPAPEVEAVIQRGLAKEKEDRYETVVAFARALESAIGASEVTAVSAVRGQTQAAVAPPAASAPSVRSPSPPPPAPQHREREPEAPRRRSWAFPIKHLPRQLEGAAMTLLGFASTRVEQDPSRGRHDPPPRRGEPERPRAAAVPPPRAAMPRTPPPRAARPPDPPPPRAIVSRTPPPRASAMPRTPPPRASSIAYQRTELRPPAHSSAGPPSRGSSQSMARTPPPPSYDQPARSLPSHHAGVRVASRSQPGRMDSLLMEPFFDSYPSGTYRSPTIELDDELPARPRRGGGGGKLFFLLLVLSLSSVGVAYTNGWRAPLAWRQSELWHTLRLPDAATPPVAPAAAPATAE